MSDQPFGPAYTWCDGDCGRCPLAAECPRTPVAGPTYPPSIAAERLRHAGLDYACRLHELICALGAAETDVARRAWAAAVRLGPRTVRLGAAASPAVLMLLEELDAECVANLASLCPLDSELAAPFMTARGALWSLLEPLQRQISETTRRTLDRLVAAGRAPSPFAVVHQARRPCA
jgi:hypothetical protein